MDSLVDINTTVLIFSDGYDTDDPQLLPRALSRIKSKSKKLIWVDPLLGRSDLASVPAHMRASRRHIDFYCAGHNIYSLRRLGAYLKR